MDATTERFIVVELEDGVQEFFDSAYQAFKYARECERKQRGSVSYIAIGAFWGEEQADMVYRGQLLRYLLRSLDNPRGWLKSVAEGLDGQRED